MFGSRVAAKTPSQEAGTLVAFWLGVTCKNMVSFFIDGFNSANGRYVESIIVQYSE